MRADMAAAYVDEPSVEAFKAKVARGVYPAPVRAKGCLPKWHREVMDRHVAMRHGIRSETPRARRNLEQLI